MPSPGGDDISHEFWEYGWVDAFNLGCETCRIQTLNGLAKRIVDKSVVDARIEVHLPKLTHLHFRGLCTGSRGHPVCCGARILPVEVRGFHLDEFQKQGYSVLEGAVAPDVVAAFRSELQPFLDSGPFGRNDFEGYRSKRVYALLAKTPSVAAMVEHPDVLALVDEVLLPN